MKREQKEASGAAEAKQKKCCVCCEYNATLQNDDSSWICEECAQIMLELGQEN